MIAMITVGQTAPIARLHTRHKAVGAVLLPRFLPYCQLSDEDPPDGDYLLRGFCQGVIYALVNVLRPPEVCVPAGVTADQATRVVVKYISARRFIVLAEEAIKDAWPCQQ